MDSQKLQPLSFTWPLDAHRDDDDAAPLPPPWEGDIDFSDDRVRQAFMTMHAQHPDLALRICRQAFCRAQATGDEQAAILALHLTSVTYYNTAQDELGDRVFSVVLQNAHVVTDPRLSLRIELNFARMLMQHGEHARAIIVARRGLANAQALGDGQLTGFALLCLAATAVRVGDADLALDVLQEQEHVLPTGDWAKAIWRSTLANKAALAWAKIARTQRSADQDAAAQAALHKAQTHALVAFETAEKDVDAFSALETLTQVLLLSGQADDAREAVDRFLAGLTSLPPPGSLSWCELQQALARIDVHTGTVSAATVEHLQTIERLHGVRFGQCGTPVLQTLVQAHERLGQHREALACHQRDTDGYPRQHSLNLRDSLQLLRHTIMSMRAEAVEFITHDLRTPLAAAQTWLETASLPPLAAAQTQLRHATALLDHYLGLLRTELTPRADFQRLDLGALADDVCESMPMPRLACFRLTRDIAVGSEVSGHAALLSKALSALLADAFGRAPTGTPVELRLVQDAAAGEVLLSISHQGPRPAVALTRRHRQWVVDRVVGVGELGLALAAKVARLHRARLRFEEVPGQGSRVCWRMKLHCGQP
jgi:signal transduction histidine kinase